MPLISLISDWGLTDHYLPMVKAKIYRRLPDVKILDITHQIPKYDLLRTAFILQHVFPECPDGSVHIIATDTVDLRKSPYLLVVHQGHFFLGSDNGVFSLLFPDTPETVYVLESPESHTTFPTYDCFADIACQLLSGIDPEKLGTHGQIQNKKVIIKPVGRLIKNTQDQTIGATLKGSVTYIDSYENIYTNITRRDFEYFKNQFSQFEIQCYDPILKISQNYSDVAPNEALALFGQDGYLQIAVNHANAAGLLGFSLKSQINIKFNN